MRLPTFGAAPVAAPKQLANAPDTLFAFLIVCAGVLALRIAQPNLPRAFTTPAVHVVAPAGAGFALFLMCGLPLDTWLRFIIWLAIGLAFYALYGTRHSRVTHARATVARG